MYQYTQTDQALVDERVAQFSEQTKRFLNGELTEEQYKPLRLMNGLYIQRHAPMLRVAIPYGLLNTKQLRTLADIANEYDKKYAHLTTRQNMQFNWIKLENVPTVLAKLATVQMHAIQTSGNCIRNVTCDQFAGVTSDEIADPRPYCELVRQWSTFHPEFSFLPRKFKFAFSGASKNDRAAVRWHDIGIYLVKHPKTQEIGFEILVGGGMGRTPFAGQVIRSFLKTNDLLSYVESILRIYNEQGRRDNMYKARIKILVNALGIDKFRDLVETEWEKRKEQYTVSDQKINAFKKHFQPLSYPTSSSQLPSIAMLDNAFMDWFNTNTFEHKVTGYRIVGVSLKSGDTPSGDISGQQMHALANLADTYNFSQIRTTHNQNFILSDVRVDQLHALWLALKKHELATPNLNSITDLIACPGFDFCSLANAPTLDLSMQIQKHFEALKKEHELPNMTLKMSGCMNACAHHHACDIGILGVNKKGAYWYQIGIGGCMEKGINNKIIGPSVPEDRLVNCVDKLVKAYLRVREENETFLQTYQRLGLTSFKEAVYS